ncbi:glycosyltransferase [Roseivivax sp. CAU 1761]
MNGINVIGMPFGMHGLGLELQDKVAAMRATGIPVCVIEQNYSSIRREMRNPIIDELVVERPKYDTNLFCHNLPAINLIKKQAPELFTGRYNIGAPYWEFPELPDAHQAGLSALDEIWVSNMFLKNCFAAHTDRPVVQMPLHQETAVPQPAAGDRNTPFTFGYIFDFNSMAARKDPNALILAFLECFSHRPKENVRLIIKYSVEASHLVRNMDVDDFLYLASLDKRIELVDAALSQEEMKALLSSFDAYVSPHRAEGLGRGIIEAMIHGKAIAATRYSGPTEFLLPEFAVPIDYYLTHVGDAALGDIKSHFTWAEVRIDSLITALDQLAQDPEQAAAKGRNAADFISRHHGPERHGQACRDELNRIAA